VFELVRTYESRTTPTMVIKSEGSRDEVLIGFDPQRIEERLCP